MHWLDYGIITVYMSVVLGIGFYFSKEENNSEDYLLGGRKMPFFAIGLSCMMTLLSSISIVVIPGEIYRNGLTLFALSGTIGLFLAIPCYLLFIRFYFKLGSFTPYEYLERRYSPGVRTMIAISSLYTRTLYIGTVLFATSKIFEGAYGWPAWLTILLVGIVGIAYTVMGGMKAVVWSDIVQFVVLGGGFIVVVIVLCQKIDGGAWEAVSYAFTHGRGVSQYGNVDFYKLTPYVRLTFWVLLYGAITAPLTTACSDQIAIQRFLSTKNWKEGYKSQIVSTLSSFPFVMILWFVGLALFTFYRQNPAPDMKDADGIFFHFIATNFPTPLPGIFMAAMLAAIMSTLDSGMNSMATVWLKEIHVKFINKNLNVEDEVKVSRWATFLIGSLAVCLGLLLDGSGKWLTQSAAEVGTLFGLLNAIVLPAFLFAVLSKRANSMLIWFFTLFAFGDGISNKVWYVLSRSAKQAWNTGESFGWAGPISWHYAIIPLLIGVLFCLPWLWDKGKRRGKGYIIMLMTGSLFLGFGQGILVWVTYSNWCITDLPEARSFMFSLPVYFALGAVALRFSRVQPEHKWRGLTIWTVNEKIKTEEEAT